MWGLLNFWLSGNMLGIIPNSQKLRFWTRPNLSPNSVFLYWYCLNNFLMGISQFSTRKFMLEYLYCFRRISDCYNKISFIINSYQCSMWVLLLYSAILEIWSQINSLFLLEDGKLEESSVSKFSQFLVLSILEDSNIELKIRAIKLEVICLSAYFQFSSWLLFKSQICSILTNSSWYFTYLVTCAD